MKRALHIMAVSTLAVVFSAACGPKNGDIHHGGDGDDIVVQDDGTVTQEISEKAKETFADAVEAFEAHEKADDWTPEACEDVVKKFEKASKEQKSGLVKAEYNIGVVWQKCGEHKKAYEAFDKANKLDKKTHKGEETYPPPIIQMGTYKLALYLKDGKKADLNKAKTLFERAIKVGKGLHPTLVEAYVNLAFIQRLEANGNEKAYQEALKNLQRALVIDSKSLHAFLQMAELYREMSELDEDDSKLDLATLVITQGQLIEGEKAEPFPAFNLTLGLLKMERGDIIGALKNFKVAYEKDDELFEAYMNYGAITIGFRGYPDAEMVFSKALELEPDNYAAHLNLGVAKRGLEKYDEAESQYKKAMEIEPNTPDAYYNMGLLYQDYRFDKAGESGYENFEEAIKWFKDFKKKAGTKKEYAEKVEDAERRIENCEQAIALMKEAAALMAEAEAIEAEVAAEEAAAAEAAEAAEAEGEGTPPSEGDGGEGTPPSEGDGGEATPPTEEGDGEEKADG